MRPAPQQPPPQMTAWQQQNHGYVQPKTDFSKKAVWALVLSIIGLILGIGFPITALIVGALAIRDTRDNPRLKGEAMAITALAIAGLGLVMHLVAIAAS
jgi:heme/copper-type cytochrome/quinol oxidase subunit 2